MGLREVLTGVFAVIGIVTTAAVAVGAISHIVPPIRKSKERKPECTHIWVAKNSKRGHIHTEYDLVCERCGEKKHIDIWDRWDKVEENDESK